MTQELLGLLTVDASQSGWDATLTTNKQKVENYVKTFALSIDTQGDTGSPSRIHIQLQNSASPGVNVEQPVRLRVRVVDDDSGDPDWDEAANATIAVAGGTTELEDLTAADKDLIVESDADGLVELDLTDASVETVHLLIGPAPVDPTFGNYHNSLAVAHDAP